MPSLGTQHPREGQVPSLDPSVQGFCYSIVLPAKDEITHTLLNRGCQNNLGTCVLEEEGYETYACVSSVMNYTTLVGGKEQEEMRIMS